MLYSGDIIDNSYQVCEEIGSGGMGVVYLAYHLRLDKYVVMKKMKNPAVSFQLLRNEVDVLKSLHHPYLPQVYDFISYEGDVYTIIDYIDGYDLKYYIDNAIQIDENQLIKWLGQLCEVLEYLHTHVPRVLHTDIKPANIIVTNTGDICLIDFGISMLGNEEIKGFSETYSSPEQYYNITCIRQGYYDYLLDLDERTDIYSLGAAFYHIITGMSPSCTVQLPSCKEYRMLNVSDSLCDVIDHAVAYDRENRFPGARSMQKAINDIYKSSSRYRLYLTIQIAASVFSCLLILLGSFLVISGLNNNLVSSYEEDYNLYLEALRRDESDVAIDRAKKIINNSDYQSLLDDKIRSDVFHGMGDCYRSLGDNQNALNCYYEASKYASGKADKETYCCDYALILIDCGRENEAESVLNELKAQYPDSPSGYLILAQLAKKKGNLDEAGELAASALSRTSDSDTRYTAYVLIGDIKSSAGRSGEAVSAYESARDIKVNAIILRKLGSEQMKLAKESGDTSQYNAALTSFRTLFDSYTPSEDDAFNLAQCYLLSNEPGGAGKCIESLKEYTKVYGKKCRAYILMAIAEDSVGGDAAYYCEEAHSIYNGLSDEDKSKIDIDSLDSIQQLYRKYCRKEW